MVHWMDESLYIPVIEQGYVIVFIRSKDPRKDQRKNPSEMPRFSPF